MDQDNYRKGVGAVILNNQGLVLVAKRLKPSNAWQMPQGGMDNNEEPIETLIRELHEEIGTSNIEILQQTPLLTYTLPPELQTSFWEGQYIGQQQYWFFTRFLGNDSEINLNAHIPAEFSEWKWIHYSQLTNIIVPFKQHLYEKLVQLGKQYKLFK